MKCETIKNMISSYIDKDLNNIEKIEIEKHLAECEQCREEYESLLDIISLCNNLEEIEPPQDFRTELHQRLIGEKNKKNFFNGIFGKKGMKAVTGIVAAILVIIIGIETLPLFLGNSTKMAQTNDLAVGYGGSSEPAAAPEMNMSNLTMDKAEDEMYEMDAAEQPSIAMSRGIAAAESSSKEAEGETIKSTSLGRMVIMSGSISLSVESVDKASAHIRQLTESRGGYVENSNIQNITVPQAYDVRRDSKAAEVTEKYAYMTIRVPETKFEDTFNDIKGMGKLANENMNGSDITSEYRDTSATVDNLKIQEQSLQQLMTKAKNVDEILKIETELNRIRTDIDMYSGNLKRWDALVQLSTINIDMKELKPEELKSVDMPGMWGKAYQGFVKAINNVVAGFEKTVVILVTAIPYLIIAGLLAVIGVAASRRIRKRKL